MMADNTKENGWIRNFMASECTNGKMARCTLVNIQMIRNTVMACTHFRMVGLMKVGGLMASNMV